MNKRKYLWAILSYVLAAASIWLVVKQSKNFKFADLLLHIQNMHKGWLLLALICMFGFIWFEGAAIMKIAKTLDHNIKKGAGTTYGAADVYFSAITPSASGGQPASAYFMMKDGMKSSVVTITLLLNLIMYSMALLSLGILSFLTSGEIIQQVSIEFKLLIIVGAGILIGLTLLFALLIYRDRIIYKCIDKLISILEHYKLVKNGNERRQRLKHSMENYRACAAALSNNKKLLLETFLLNVLQRLSQLLVTFTVFMACGKGIVLSAKATVMQTFVAVASNSIPIPGAMGAADYMMLDGFTGLVGTAEAPHMELLCRGIMFYGCVLTGGVLTLIGYVRRRGKEDAGVL